MDMQQHLVVELELEQADRVQDDQLLTPRDSISSTHSCSRVTLSPPPQWGINDLDFYSNPPRASSSQDPEQMYAAVALHQASDMSSCEQHLSSWEDWPLASTDLQMPATPSRSSSFTSLLEENVFTNPPASPAPAHPRENSGMPSMKLHVWASGVPRVSIPAGSGGRVAPPSRGDSSALSPTMMDKKILVTDSDLRLFSTTSSSLGNMRCLSGGDATDEFHTSHAAGRLVRFSRDKLFPQNTKSTQSPVKHAAGTSPSSSSQRRHVSVQVETESCGVTNPLLYQARDSVGSMFDVAEEDFNNALSSPLVLLAAMHGVKAQRERERQPSDPTPSERQIGIYSPAERRERLRRFHEKRKHRVYHKRIKYDCRKRLANACPRIKGRFVRKTDFLKATKSNAEASTSSTRTAGQ